MIKPDDSSLDPDDLRAVEGHARKLLDRADAWDRFPTPIDDILAAAEVTVAPTSMFDPQRMLAYLRDKSAEATRRLKSAIAKVLGLYDADERIIHIDDTVGASKQVFLKLHETGHHELPAHARAFRIFQDCEKTLDPDIADQFEREANNFARCVLFQGDAYRQAAADCTFGIKTPLTLARRFGGSVYASCREFARTNHRACAVYVLEPVAFVEGDGARAVVRRIIPSPGFARQFGRPADVAITPDHVLGPVLPIGRKMTRPTTVLFEDRNGTVHECLAEAFDTTWNILILVYPVKALTRTTVVMPTGFHEAIAD